MIHTIDPRLGADLADIVQLDYKRARRPARHFQCRSMEATVYAIPIASLANETKLVCVLRGSEDLRDWRRNLRCVPWPRDGYWWHLGFLGEAEQVLSWLYRTGMPDLFTGHSRGAAIAQILASWTRVPAVGFAAPRPAWLFAPRVHNVTLWNGCGDPVCYAGRILGYRHVGIVKWLPLLGHTMRHYQHELTRLATRTSG